CLKYEQENYEEKLKRLPKVGAIVKTPDGEGEVCMVEILKEMVKVKLNDGEDIFYKRYNANEIKLIRDSDRNDTEDEDVGEEELEELKKLEKLDELEVKNEEEI